MYSLIKNIYKHVKEDYHAWDSYQRQYSLQKDHNVRFYNWWKVSKENNWFYQFVNARNLIPTDNVINFVSVFGERNVILHINDGPIVFFSAENLHYRFEDYAGYCLTKNEAQLGIGFDCFEADNYIRIGGYRSLISPLATEHEIIEFCSKLRYPNLSQRPLFASMIGRADWFGLRTEMVNKLNEIDLVHCPSKLCHNDDTLQSQFNDDKMAYLQQFAFNICPENTNSYGYVTEKLYEAIASGCIPVYWGSYNLPDPNIINPDAVIFWKKDGDNSANIKLIMDLWSHKDHLEEFLRQPRLLPDAENIILSRIDELSHKISALY